MLKKHNNIETIYLYYNKSDHFFFLHYSIKSNDKVCGCCCCCGSFGIRSSIIQLQLYYIQKKNKFKKQLKFFQYFCFHLKQKNIFQLHTHTHIKLVCVCVACLNILYYCCFFNSIIIIIMCVSVLLLYYYCNEKK